METNYIIGAIAGFLGSYITLGFLVYNQGAKQAKEVNSIITTVNASISGLNDTVTKLNTTLDFVRTDIARQDSRMTMHGKEIEHLEKETVILKTNQDRILATVEKIEENCLKRNVPTCK